MTDADGGTVDGDGDGDDHDDRTVNRKVQPNAGEADPDAPTHDDAGDAVDETDTHDDGDDVLTAMSKTLSTTTTGIVDAVPPARTTVTAGLYGTLAVGALSVAYGTTAVSASFGGVHVGLIVGGAFAFLYAFAILAVMQRVTQ
jgi:hypothetical protein